jgi:hypothetical protein
MIEKFFAIFVVLLENVKAEAIFCIVCTSVSIFEPILHKTCDSLAQL